LLDASQFDDHNCGVTPSVLYRRLDGAIPAGEDIVVVHGDATLSNLLIGSDGELGFIDCGHSGRSDRYVDLAVIEAELLTQFGRDAAECFNEAMGFGSGTIKRPLSSETFTSFFDQDCFP
jgi:aminoglycoside 3'-phosphotransferase II